MCCKTWTVVASCESAVVARDAAVPTATEAARVATWLNQQAETCASGSDTCDVVRVPCASGQTTAIWRPICEASEQVKDASLQGPYKSQLARASAWSRAALQASRDTQTLLARYQARPDATVSGLNKASGLLKDLVKQHERLQMLTDRLAQASTSEDPARLVKDHAALMVIVNDKVAQSRRLLQSTDAIDARYAEKVAKREQAKASDAERAEQRRLAAERLRSAAEQERLAKQQRESERAAERAARAEAAAQRQQAEQQERAAAAAEKSRAEDAQAQSQADSERGATLAEVAHASNQADAGLLSAVKLMAATDLSSADRQEVASARADLEKAKLELSKSFTALKATQSESSGRAQLEQIKKLKAEVAVRSSSVEAARKRLLRVVQKRAAQK